MSNTIQQALARIGYDITEVKTFRHDVSYDTCFIIFNDGALLFNRWYRDLNVWEYNGNGIYTNETFVL